MTKPADKLALFFFAYFGGLLIKFAFLQILQNTLGQDFARKLPDE